MMHFILSHPIACLWLAFCAGAASATLIIRDGESLDMDKIAKKMREDFQRQNAAQGEKRG